MDSFFPVSNIKQPQKGDLLISEPFLPDPNFERTVVLLCDHNEDGSFGFVLNKPGILRISDVIEDLEPFDTEIFVGGPVEQDTVHFLHRIPATIKGGQEIVPGIFWGGDFEGFSSLARTGVLHAHDFRFYIGYSGWGSGQLVGELEKNSWLIYRPVKPEQVFEIDPEVLWRRVLEEMGGKFKMFANYPTDPRLN